MKKDRPGFLFAVCYMAYAAACVSRLNYSVLTPLFEASSLMDKAQIGFLGSAFFFTYAVGQLLNGFLGDRLSPQLMVVTGLSAAGVCNILIGFLPPYPAILLLWALNGYAQSMIWGPLLRFLSAYFPDDKKRSYMVSLLVSSVAVGSVLGILIASRASAACGVGAGFWLPGAVTLTVAVTALFLLRGKRVPPPAARAPLRSVFKNSSVLSMLFPAFADGVIKDNISLWAAVFFMDSFGIDLQAMTFFVFLIPLITLAGRLLYPLLLRLCRGRENIVSIGAFGACVLIVIPLCFGGFSPVVAAICLCIAAAAVNIVNTSLLSVFPMKFTRTGTVSSVAGVMDFASYLGAGLSATVFGLLIKAGGYTAMFISWAILSLVSICIIRLFERRTV